MRFWILSYLCFIHSVVIFTICFDYVVNVNRFSSSYCFKEINIFWHFFNRWNWVTDHEKISPIILPGYIWNISDLKYMHLLWSGQGVQDSVICFLFFLTACAKCRKLARGLSKYININPLILTWISSVAFWHAV